MKNFLKKIIIKELAFCARHVYLRFKPYVVGVTGSSGKTTTKCMMAELLDSVGCDVLVSRENLNSEYGLPLAILGYKSAPKNLFSWLYVFISSPFIALLKFKFPKYAVLEYATDKPGDIRYLSKLVPPDLVVITNMGVAHIEAFRSAEAIAKEKWSLASTAEKVIISPQVASKIKSLQPVKADIIEIGSSKTIKAKNIRGHKNKTIIDLEIQGQVFGGIEFAMIGSHNVENLLLSLLACIKISGETKRLVKSICKLKPLEGRGRKFIIDREIVIVDESYNANPASMIAALSNLKQGGFGRKVAILGEMKELGHISKKAHVEVARIAKTIADLTVGVGAAFKNEGFDRWYANSNQLIKDLDTLLEKDDTVLVKGSHSVGLDKIIRELEERKI